MSLLSTPTVVLHRFETETTTPADTIARCVAFLAKYKGRYVGLGIATFGPVCLSPSSPSFGRVLQTPKAGWSGTDVVGPFRAVDPRVPLRFDTDVNAPALAEHTLGAPPGAPLSSVAYVTVGTGVGVGLVVNGKPVHGLVHPEGGHVPVRQLPGDEFGGYSWGGGAPYGGKGTVESLASAVGLCERLGHPSSTASSRSLLKTLPPDHEAWDHCANALANLCASLVLLCSVERIVLSGGVMQAGEPLFARVRARTRQILNGYVQRPEILEDGGLAAFIGPSTWGNEAGVVGALNLARLAREESLGEGGGGKKKKGEATELEQARMIVRGVMVGAGMGVLVGAAAGAGAVLLSRRRR
ncbi:hypothetical protein TeGR_g1581 [Tetraparma gracilis]|uniref:fructokinase n=1 Tax=Tetraparma gracilis TaxID=2962635 RepID=A0ABQ6MWA8_9STRA|nr:hypothetical protein TeGR_g1581 [Tetraparma gracilis]